MTELDSSQTVIGFMLAIMWIHMMANIFGMTEWRIARHFTPFSDIGVLLVQIIALPGFTYLFLLMSGFFK